MPITRLNHAVLYVRNVDASVAFYTESLGFNVVHDVGSEPPLDLTQPPLGQRRLAKFLPLMCSGLR